MSVKDHIHIYTRRDKSTFRCNHPDCTHWIHRKDVKGKRSICSICLTNEIILTTKQLKLSFPRCMSCSNTKEAKTIKERQELLKEIGLT